MQRYKFSCYSYERYRTHGKKEWIRKTTKDIEILAKRQLATSIKNYPEFNTFDEHFEQCYSYMMKRLEGFSHFNLWTNNPVLVKKRDEFEKSYLNKEFTKKIYKREWQRISSDGTIEKIKNYYLDY